MKDYVKGSHLLPFLWIRGEDDATLRQYVDVIHKANCNAFCVESRPHPDFCGEQWWHDMDILLEEAQKRDMQVWILDDSHFPTGYANGALKEGKVDLCRQSVFCHQLRYQGRARNICLPLEKLKTPPKYPQKFIWKLAEMQLGEKRKFDDDQVFSITALGPNGQVQKIESDIWQKPAGNWTVAVCGLSRNLGPHRNYINMMEEKSCRLLINQVYEPHWQHYREHFGKTIAGFFSDEPELGNFVLYAHHNVLGTHQDLPWSESLARELENRWGHDFGQYLPLLWLNDRDPKETARIRVEYMDTVTRLVQKSFSEQIGTWCNEHGVQYIGHVIEDNNTHTCTGASLGHYFRGLSGQDMAGIDDIGGQVLPQGEDISAGNSPVSTERDGEFYHYMLAKLAVSAAQLEERKQGRAMCEIFGNYGWGLTMREMKYIADHFLVRGINYFVPHAFSMADFPDQDCPPHFYAHGHNPLYRHAGHLFSYMDRVAEKISGGEIVSKVAILYNAEAEWADAKNSMLPQKIGRVLYDRQIDYTILPIDYLDQAGKFDAVIVPACRFLPEQVRELKNALYIDRLPEGFTGKVVKLENLISQLKSMGLPESVLTPENDRIRILHYRGKEELFLLVNEGNTAYHGQVKLPLKGELYAYDPWVDKTFGVRRNDGDVELHLNAGDSLILIAGHALPVAPEDEDEFEVKQKLTVWNRMLCRSVDYPKFADAKQVSLPDDVSKTQPSFSGFIRYETEFDAVAQEQLQLEVTESWDSMEVFLNGRSLGIQVKPPFVYDLGELAPDGKNYLAIEVATTAARDVNARVKSWILKKVFPLVLHRTGITGDVTLYRRKQK